ncbi:GspMb/PilO family protein [Litorivivens sp.]|uniref:GspMb/PilO family protein n=1 Tax=Litorivivens sp. TaxID=2020868 RepID=UPI00356569AF
MATINWSEHVEPRSLRLLLSGLLLLMVTALVVYVIKPQITAYNALARSNASLNQAIAYGPDLETQIQSRYVTMADLEAQLFGTAGAVSADKIESHIVGALQNISWQYGVTLEGVKPMPTKRITIFDEIPFEVSLRGDYFSLFSWLQAVNQQLGFIVVDHFEVASSGRAATDPNLIMTLRMANYRVAQ